MPRMSGFTAGKVSEYCCDVVVCDDVVVIVDVGVVESVVDVRVRVLVLRGFFAASASSNTNPTKRIAITRTATITVAFPDVMDVGMILCEIYFLW